MASVQMSGILKDEILANYEKQLRTAYEAKTGVAEIVDQIRLGMENTVPLLKDFRELKSSAEFLLDEFKKQTMELVGPDNISIKDFWRSSMFSDGYGSKPNLVGLTETRWLYCVINDKRPIEKNLSYIFDWHAMYEKADYYIGHNKIVTEPASENYVDGDLYFAYEFTTPLLLPLKLDARARYYQAKHDYAPYVDIGLVISDPEMYNVLKQVSETDIKVAEAVQTMKDCLEQFTTLKRFLDEFSGGMALVPEEYKQRLAKKTPPRKKSVKVKPEAIIPDDIKDQMAEVVFENSLLK
tara:strand:+ start:3439 stop:4326 length:888 start_codon:yes stop_codon:yes gene_type:complete